MTKVDIDHLSNQELSDLTKQLCQQVFARQIVAAPLAIPGNGEQPIGLLVPISPATPEDIDPEFLAELRRRVADPPSRYLSVDEFLGALDEYWSKADAIGHQLDSANGNDSQAS